MVPMPRFLCLVFDWLWFSWEERTGQDQQSLFVDEDGLFEDDRAVHQTLLHSRSRRLISIVLTLLSLILSLLLLENPLVTSRNVNLGRIASKIAELLVLFVFPLVPCPIALKYFCWL